jgi:hypothetical protein
LGGLLSAHIHVNVATHHRNTDMNFYIYFLDLFYIKSFQQE